MLKSNNEPENARGLTLCLTALLEVGMYEGARGREQLLSWNEKLQ